MSSFYEDIGYYDDSMGNWLLKDYMGILEILFKEN